MDPLSLLKAEIEKKKRKRENETNDRDSTGAKKKWRTRAEIEKESQSKEQQKQLDKEAANIETYLKDKPDVSEKTTTSGSEITEKVKKLLPPKDEVTQRLRQRGHPITLFGETDIMRYERLKNLEASEDLTYTQGQRNDFGRHMEQLDDYQHQIDAGDVVHKEREMRDFDETWKLGDGRKGDEKDEQYIRRFLQRILTDWEVELESMDKGKKQSFEWKRLRAVRNQCYQYVSPFLKKLRKQNCDRDVILHIAQVVEACEHREYVKVHGFIETLDRENLTNQRRAMDWYTKLAIGNAPWPIGVTMVGIHERSGREKISEQLTSAAHILSNEEERKYIQQIKRLMTKCQQLFPSHAPSKELG